MIINANSIKIPLEDESVHMCVTSPPYYGLRDYGLKTTEWAPTSYHPMPGLAPLEFDAWYGCLGQEPTPEMFVAHIVDIFREVHRVLRKDGTLWLNFGDSYSGSNKGLKKDGTSTGGKKQKQNKGSVTGLKIIPPGGGLKPKDLMGIPWRVALALQADGWYLRNDIIWNKTNSMPESVKDRCTRAHEYLFLLSKSRKYFYDNEAIKEPATSTDNSLRDRDSTKLNNTPGRERMAGLKTNHYTTRNKRDVWTLSTRPYKGAHFATFPTTLVEPCVLAGTSAKGVCPKCGNPWKRVTKSEFIPQGDVSEGKGVRGSGDQKPMDESNTWEGYPRGSTATETIGWCSTCGCSEEPVPAKVLDPFAGSGTVGEVCKNAGRKFIGLDLSEQYLRDFALLRAEGKQTQASLDAMPLFQGGLL
jgi:DNA modification methylase